MNKIGIFFFFLFVVSCKLFSQSTIPAAQSVFLYNFTRLIEWPADYKTGDFNIGVYGSTEVFTELKNYTASKSVASQPIKVFKFNTVAEITKCHILFVAYAKTKDLPEITAKLNNGTLIVGENRTSLEKGAAVNFVILDDKLKFEIKVSNASKGGLKIHSNLENMAVNKY
jgi:hypothetical protein